MEMYLSNEEIEQLKGLRHQNIKDSELNELKKFLETNKKKLSIKSWENSNNVYNIMFFKHKDNILNTKYYKEYREKNPSVYSNKWEEFIFKMYFNELDPSGFRMFKLAESMNLEDNKLFIEDIINNSKISFDIESFLLNKDFDFSPYQIQNSNKKEYESIGDAAQNILILFDDITKNLSIENKEVFKNNFFQVFDYVIKNVGKNDVKEKNNVFKNLLIYVNEKRIKK